jgi:hypothetical protein
MSELFGMTGALTPRLDMGLTEKAKSDLSEIMAAQVKDKRKIAVLLEEIDYAVKTYPSARALQDNIDPPTVRADLKKASKAALALHDRLNALDEQTLRLLEQDGEDAVNQMRHEVSQFLIRLNAATDILKKVSPRGGGVTDVPKQLLVAHIAHLFRTLTTIKPTTTVEGFFEHVISVIVADVDNRESDGQPPAKAHRSVHDLILKSLRVKVTVHPDGVVSFNPWVGQPRRKSG